MFLFGKKKDTIKVNDVVFISTTSKWQACLDAFKINPSVIFITWFDETRQQLQAFLKEKHVEKATTLLYRETNTHSVSGKQIIFAEHYPLKEKEEMLYTSLNLSEVKVFSSLEEPIFQYFGGGRMMELMKKLGVQENEPIEHPTIGMALKNAQEKLAKKVSVESGANSQSAWFNKNIPSEK